MRGGGAESTFGTKSIETSKAIFLRSGKEYEVTSQQYQDKNKKVDNKRSFDDKDEENATAEKEHPFGEKL